MKKQVFNPFFPLNEYIPDGEPHVFGDRVYLYGSHDMDKMRQIHSENAVEVLYCRTCARCVCRQLNL